MSARQAAKTSSHPKSAKDAGNAQVTRAAKPKASPKAVEESFAGGDEDLSDDVESLEVVASDDGGKPIKEDPALDRRIIEGMLNDRQTLLEDLAKEGMTQGMVLRRAAELGLSEALLRQVKGVAADLAGERPGRKPAPSSLGARTCLSCDRVFLSTGPGNRLCMRCRGGDAGLAQF